MEKKIAVNATLGTLVMYSLETTAKVSIQDLRDQSKIHNVPSYLIPNPLSSQGAFQRATTMVASKIVTNKEPVLCKEVENTKERIVRTFEKRITDTDEIVETIAEGLENVPVYTHVATMVYDKRLGVVTKHILHPCGESLVEKAMALYGNLKGWHNIQQIRRMIQNAFKAYGSISLRGNGGVNFIPKEHSKEFANFVKVVSWIDGVDIVSLDIKNSPNNRSQIQNAVGRYIEDSLENELKALGGKSVGSQSLKEMVADFTIALHSKTMPKEKLDAILKRFKEVSDTAKAYENLLQCDLTIVQEQLAVARGQVGNMLNKFSGQD